MGQMLPQRVVPDYTVTFPVEACFGKFADLVSVYVSGPTILAVDNRKNSISSVHYHLLLETPAGNLKWFQGTYTARV